MSVVCTLFVEGHDHLLGRAEVSVSSKARPALDKGVRWLISRAKREWWAASSAVTWKISVG